MTKKHRSMVVAGWKLNYYHIIYFTFYKIQTLFVVALACGRSCPRDRACLVTKLPCHLPLDSN